MTMRRPPNVQHPVTMLRGGMDQVTPSLSLPSGYCIDAINFECSITGGYSRIKGYERLDGRPAPSAATYTVVQIASFLATPTVGQTLANAAATASGVIAAIASNYMVLTKVTGTFGDTDEVKVGATTIGFAVPFDGTISSLQRAQYLNAAADIYRADITAVGGAAGTGSVLGAFNYKDVWYAFRALAATPTLAGLWKSTTGGWTLVAYPNEVTFDTAVGTGTGNLVAPADGETITGGTSAKTATVRRVMLETGAWKTAATTADGGKLVYTNLAGAANWTIGETVTFSGGATAIVRSAGAAITMLVGGKLEAVLGNFSGQLSTLRVYGADGVNRAFEFDGTYLCPIKSGYATDTPKHVSVHLNYLMLSKEGSIVYSEVGYPFRFATGGEITTGDIVTGMAQLPGSQDTGSLAVFLQNGVKILYGTAPPFRLPPYNVGAGAVDYSYQNFGDTFFFNENGISNLSTTLKFGNFNMASLIDQIMPFVLLERTKVAYSCLCREKNQYRIFFNDGLGLFLTMSKGKPLGVMPVYFPNTVYCAFNGRLTDKTEVSAFGATDGFLYQMEKGTSFDGANIDAAIQLTWDANGSPRIEKTYQHATIEVRSPTYAAMSFSYELGYGSEEYAPSEVTNLFSNFQGLSFWDLFTWDEFVWDGRQLLPSEADMEGTAENVQVILASSTDYIDSFTINSLIFSLINRRAKR